MQIHNQLSACLSAFCRRDSALFITRFINLNANWFCEGLSDWGPSLPPLIVCLRVCVYVCVLCTCWKLEWHVLTEQPLLPVCLPQVWHWYGLSAPNQRDKYYTHTNKNIAQTSRHTGQFQGLSGISNSTENANAGSCTVAYATTGWIKQRM